MASSPITISLAGLPQGKGRAPSYVRGGRIGHFTPEKTRSYENMIRSAAMDALAGRPPRITRAAPMLSAQLAT
jgi:hypothetical protein